MVRIRHLAPALKDELTGDWDTGSVLAMVLTTISVCSEFSTSHLVSLLICLQPDVLARVLPLYVLFFLSVFRFSLQADLCPHPFLFKLNLEVPQYEFNDAEGKLVIG